MRGPLIVAPLAVAVGCAQAPAPTSSAEALRGAGPLPAAVSACREVPSSLASAVIAPPVLRGASVALHSPRGRIPATGIADVKVELEVHNAMLGRDASAIAVALDARAPRQIETVGQSLTLGDLIFEDDAITPGEHVLAAAIVRASDGIAVAVDDAGMPAAAWVRFVVGDYGAPSSGAGPLLFLLEPRGTYNGDAARAPVIASFVTLDGAGRSGECVRLGIVGPSVNANYALRSPRAVRFDALESGDYQLRADLLDASGAPVAGPLARVERRIVVNRDVRPGAAP